MITISEKDGSTIIVVENPTGSEQRIIEQARRLVNSYDSSFWAKNNEMRGTAPATQKSASGWGKPKQEESNSKPVSLESKDGFINMDDFEEIYNPFGDEPPF